MHPDFRSNTTSGSTGLYRRRTSRCGGGFSRRRGCSRRCGHRLGRFLFGRIQGRHGHNFGGRARTGCTLWRALSDGDGAESGPVSRPTRLRAHVDFPCPHYRARKWKDDFTWLFGLRDSAVHFHESFSAPVPHPISGHGSPPAAHYCLETARRAVDLLLDVLKVIVNAETARNADARTYATNMRPTVDRLCCQGS